MYCMYVCMCMYVFMYISPRLQVYVCITRFIYVYVPMQLVKCNVYTCMEVRMYVRMVRYVKLVIVRSQYLLFRDIVAVNSGGPYGSSVLAGVEADSNKVWTEVRSSAKYDNWHKASLYVQACDSDSSGRDRWSVSPRNGQGNICGGPYYFTR